jgi:alpha-galactosidase
MKDVKNLKIAYIGGGSRGWARNLMVDLAKEPSLAGTVYLYDIDFDASKINEKIGNRLFDREDVLGKWKYVAEPNLNKSLEDADIVIISILPGTLDEMESDVHAPEKYGIYQSVGDTTGPGGIIRALRTVPIFRQFAKLIKEICPNAWVINFTNPMTLCVGALYKEFPQIKAFGCCHEVFGTQKILQRILKDEYGEQVTRDDIEINVMGVNHFTWVDKAYCKGKDLIPIYEKYIDEHPEGLSDADLKHWANGVFATSESVKFDLFKRYGVIAAAGDRHLAEFCPREWYLNDPETVEKWGYSLTSVAFRRQDYAERIEKANALADGKEQLTLYETGEESVRQIKSLCGLGGFLTNVNIPNVGQMPQLPIGAIVETNAYFSSDSVRPVYAGVLPDNVHALVERICREQQTVLDGIFNDDYELVFTAFLNSPNVPLKIEDARKLFDEMIENTKNYLPKTAYEKYVANKK